METKQTQAEIDDKRLGETLDRYRNEGTLAGKIMIDRETLESIVENRINRALVISFKGMIDTLVQWQEQQPIADSRSTRYEPVLDMLFDEIDKLEN